MSVGVAGATLTAAAMRAKVEQMKTEAGAMRDEVQGKLGTDYLHIIGAAETIGSVLDCSRAVLTTVRQLPARCAAIASQRDGMGARAEGGRVDAPLQAAANVKLIVDAPEAIHSAIESSRHLDALRTFVAANAAHDNLVNGHCGAVEGVRKRFPWVELYFASMQGTQSAMAVSARDFLSQPPARGRGAECAPARAAAFAAALAVHRKLSGLTVQQCFELFLEARGRAADALLLPDMGSAGTDAGAATGAAANASVHSLAMLVAVVRDTLLDIDAVFFGPDDGVISDEARDRREGNLLAVSLASCASEDKQADACVNLDEETTRRACKQWLEQRAAKASTSAARLGSVASLSQLATSKEYLAQLCASVGAEKASATEAGRWRAVCLRVLGYVPDLWQDLCENAIGSRAQQLFGDVLRSTGEELDRTLNDMCDMAGTSTAAEAPVAPAASAVGTTTNTYAGAVFDLDPLVDRARAAACRVEQRLRDALREAAPLLQDSPASASAVPVSSSVRLRKTDVLRTGWRRQSGAFVVSRLSAWRSHIEDLLSQAQQTSAIPSPSTRLHVLCIGLVCEAVGENCDTLQALLGGGSRLAAPPSDAQVRAAFEASHSGAPTGPQGCSTEAALDEQQLGEALTSIGFTREANAQDQTGMSVYGAPRLACSAQGPISTRTTLQELQLAMTLHYAAGNASTAALALSMLRDVGGVGVNTWARAAANALGAPLCSGPFAPEQLDRSDDAWRADVGGWERVTIADEGDEGEAWQDTVWLPASASPRLATMLFELSVELQVCVSAASLAASADSAGGGSHARAMQDMAWRCIVAKYGECLRAPELRGEAKVLQMLFDLSFARAVLGAPSGVADARALSELTNEAQSKIDPVDWELYEPLMASCVRRHVSQCSLLFLTHAQESAPAKSTHDSARGAAQDPHIVPVAPAVARFALLPAPRRFAQPAATSGRGAERSTTSRGDGRSGAEKALLDGAKKLGGALSSVWSSLQ